MQNISDLSFHEFGNSEAFEEETDLNEDYSKKNSQESTSMDRKYEEQTWSGG